MLAALVLWGPAVAVLLQAMTITVSELMERKPPWKLFFNVGQYVLSICGAAAVLWVGGIQPTPTGPPVVMGVEQLPWVVAALVTYHVLNLAFVAGLAGTAGQSFWECFTDDFVYYTFTYFAVAALTPIVVVVAEGPWIFLPLLLLPLSAVWKTAAISREKERQALHDGLTDLPNRTR